MRACARHTGSKKPYPSGALVVRQPFFLWFKSLVFRKDLFRDIYLLFYYGSAEDLFWQIYPDIATEWEKSQNQIKAHK
jgi:hypothetical protein